MNKIFILVFNEYAGPHEEVTKFLDSLSAVGNWYSYMRNCIFILAPSIPIQSLNAMLAPLRRRPGALYFISAVDINQIDGWMPKAFWDFLREPKTAIEELKEQVQLLQKPATMPPPPNLLLPNDESKK